MQNVTYDDLLGRYGINLAYDLLITIEKLARIKAPILGVGEDARLQRALDALSAESRTVQA